MAYDPALRQALETTGGPTALAKHLGIGASAITQWQRIPARHLLRIADLTGLPPHVLRPDLAPAPSPRAVHDGAV